jgi:hypothetical protein
MNFSSEVCHRNLFMDKELIMKARLRIFTLLCFLLLPIVVCAQGLTTATIDQALGRSGQKTGDVYRVGFLRTDLRVSVNGLAIKPGLAAGIGRPYKLLTISLRAGDTQENPSR